MIDRLHHFFTETLRSGEERVDKYIIHIVTLYLSIKVHQRKVQIKLIKMWQPRWLNPQRRLTRDMWKIFASLYPLEWLLTKVKIDTWYPL